MTLIQIELNDEENEIVSIYKIKKKLLTKSEAIKRIIVEKKKEWKV